MLCSLQNLHQNLFTADKKYLIKNLHIIHIQKTVRITSENVLKKNMTVYDLDVRVQKRF